MFESSSENTQEKDPKDLSLDDLEDEIALLCAHIDAATYRFLCLVRELNKPGYTDVMVQNWAKSGSPLPPPDFSKLPPADHIASFFNVSYQYAEATSDGIHQQIILKY